VVEEEDSVATRDVVKDELLDFWVIILLDRMVLYKVLLRRVGNVRNDLEGILVECVFGFLPSNVVDWNLDVESTKVPLRLTLWLFLHIVEGGRTVFGRAEVV